MSALINFSLNIKDLPKDKLIQGKKEHTSISQ